MLHQLSAGNNRAGRLRGVPAAGLNSAQYVVGVPGGSIVAGGRSVDPGEGSLPQPTTSAADATRMETNNEAELRIVEVACRSIHFRIALPVGRDDNRWNRPVGTRAIKAVHGSGGRRPPGDCAPAADDYLLTANVALQVRGPVRASV